MRVVIVSTFPPRRCGIGDYTADLAYALVRSGDVSLRVLTYPDGLDPAVTRLDGFEVSRKLGQIPMVEQIGSELETFQADLIHLQSSSFLHAPVLNDAVADASRVPLVTTVHDTPSSWRLFYTIGALRKVYGKSLRLIVHSSTVSRKLSGFHDVDAARIVQVPHGVDVNSFSPSSSGEEARAILGLEGKRIVLFFGFLRRGKGVENLLRAWRLVENRLPDALLVVAGGSPSASRKYLLNLRDETNYPNVLARLAKSLAIDRRVRFTGYVQDKFVPGLLASADVIVLPYEAPFSQSGPLHKALASGRPLIASRIQGSEELLVDGKTALLVPPGDVQALAEAIHRLLTSSELAKNLSEHARRFAEARLDWSIVARKIIAVYSEALGVGQPFPWIDM